MNISHYCEVRVHFIVHGGRKSALKTEMYLAAHQPPDYAFFFHRTASREDVSALVQKFRADAELLVVAGGDGLFSLTVKALLQSDGPMPLLALIPCGSGNDFARNFGWTSSGQEFLQRLHQLRIVELDTGEIHSETQSDVFTNETSTGISNAVVQFVDRKPARWSGDIKFGLSILQAFVTFRKRKYTIRWEDGSWSGKAMLVACCNGRYFGSGVGIAPDALVDDGLLELVIIGNVNLLHYLIFLPKLRRSERINHHEVHYVRARSIEILSDGAIERDGEPGMSLPVTVKIRPRSMRVLG